MPNVRVVVRCRPHEAQQQHHQAATGATPQPSIRSTPTPHAAATTNAYSSGAHWELSGEQRIVLKAPASAVQVAGGTAAAADRIFQLNRVYAGTESQKDFFRAEVQPLLDLAMAAPTSCSQDEEAASDAPPPPPHEGCSNSSSSGPTNVVLFAYGQTGSGKTHTVDGRRAAALAASEGQKPRERGGQPPPNILDVSGSGWTAASPKRGGGGGSDRGDAAPKHSADPQQNAAADGVEARSDDEANGATTSGAADNGNDEGCSDDDTDTDGEEGTEDDRDTAGEGVAPRSLRYIFDAWQLQQAHSGRAPILRYAAAADGDASATPSNEPSPRHDAQPPTPTRGRHTQGDGGADPSGSGLPPFELVRVSVSFLEIYNEKLFDLLSASFRGAQQHQQRQPLRRKRMAPSAAAISAMHSECLRLRRSATSGRTSTASSGYQPAKFEVENLTKLSCIDLDEALEYYYYGVSKKVFRAHNLNSQSSRAHSIFTVYLTFRDNTVGDEGGGGTSEAPLITGEVAIVDLAGSERLNSILPSAGGTATSAGSSRRPSSTGGSSGDGRNHAALITESIHINKSLLTLGKVIMALSEGPSESTSKPNTPGGGGGAGRHRPTSKNGAARLPPQRTAARHTPFRDSKLTMVMNHALGGNARTLMVACVHLDPAQVSESLSTLFYATRTNKIANVVVSLEDPKTLKIKTLSAEVAALKLELEAANNTIADLQQLQEGGGDGGGGCRVGAASRPVAGGSTPAVASIPSVSPAPPPLAKDGAGSIATQVQEDGSPTAVAAAVAVAFKEAATPPSGSGSDQVEIPLDLSEKLREACTKLKMVLEANARLRRAFDDERGRAAAAEREREALETDNLRLREKLDLYDSLLLAQIAINREYDTSSSLLPSRKQLQQHRGASANHHHHHHPPAAYRLVTHQQRAVFRRPLRATATSATSVVPPKPLAAWTRETSDVLPTPEIPPSSAPPSSSRFELHARPAPPLPSPSLTGRMAPQAPHTPRGGNVGSAPRPASASAGATVPPRGAGGADPRVPPPPALFGAGVPLQFLLRGVPTDNAASS